MVILICLACLVLPLRLSAEVTPSPTPAPTPAPTPSPTARIQELAGKLSKDDLDLTLYAALELLKMKDSPEALNVLTTTLKVREPEVRIKIMKAFEVQRDPRANDVIVEALGDPSDPLRQAAISALSAQATDTLIEPLSRALLAPNNSERAKSAAALVLKAKRDKQSIALLIEALKANTGKAKAACAAALADLSSFDFGDDAERWANWWNEIKDLGREQLLELILQRREDQLAQARKDLKAAEAETAKALISALDSRPDKTSVAPLVEPLKSKYTPVRIYAAGELGKIRTEEAATALLEAARDADPDVRKEALNSLGKIGEKAKLAVDAVASRLTNDSVPTVRAAAAGALNAIKDPGASFSLVDALYEDSSPEVRAKSAQALGSIGDPKAADALVRALWADPDPTVQREAALALGKVGDLKAVSVLADKRFDQDQLVRRAVAQSLGMLGGADAVSALLDLTQDANPLVREAAYLSLGSTAKADQALASLAKGLLDGTESVAKAASDALVKLLGNDIDAYLKLSDQLSQSSVAIKLYELALQRATGNGTIQEKLAAVKKRLADLYFKDGNFKKAIPLYEELAAKSPTLEVLQPLAAAYEASGNYLDGAKTRLSAAATQGSDAEAQWNFIVKDAEELKTSGRIDELRQLLSYLAQTAPDLGTPDTKAALEVLMAQVGEPPPPSRATPAPTATSPTSSPTPEQPPSTAS